LHQAISVFLIKEETRNETSFFPCNTVNDRARNITDIKVDVLGGESIDAQLEPLSAGRYTFFCANKLMFMKSHREKGMEGTLLVVTE